MSEVRSPFRDVAIEEVNVCDLVLNGAEQLGGAIAMVDGQSGRAVTYSELVAMVTRCQRGVAGLGVTSRDVVALYAGNSLQWEVLFLACAGLGVTMTTVNSNYKKYEFANQIKVTGATYVFVDNNTIPIVLETMDTLNIKKIITRDTQRPHVSFSDLLATQHSDVTPPRPHINLHRDACVIASSSGTSGLPKAVILTHRNLVAQTLIAKSPELVPLYGDVTAHGPIRCLALMPFYHVYGMVLMLKCLRSRHTVVILERFQPELFLQSIDKYQVTLLPLAPPLVVFLAKSPLVRPHSLRSVRFILSGAAPLDADTQRALSARFGRQLRVVQGYGLTETSAGTHGNPNMAEEIPAGSIGKVMPNLTVKVVDPTTLAPLGPGRRGELWVKGPTVFRGYLGNPAATRACLSEDGWLRTGDVAVYDDQGWFYIVDRLKEIIKYKGFQIAPAELEGVLINLPSVMDVGVVGVRHDSHGEVPLAFIVRASDDVTAEQIHREFNKQVADYKHLRGGVRFVTAVPKSASGKILSLSLYSGRFGSGVVTTEHY